MRVEKIKQLEHSGFGGNATHKKVISAFNKGEEEGIRYCERRGYSVIIRGGLLKVTSNLPFGFKMVALVS